ncbi:MAG: hypothetical protein RIR91_339 [Verrucomicrobiota bacterium]|jgi:hypothetical protein
MNLALSRLADTRRANLRRLADQHGATALALKIGYSNVSFLCQMIGPNPRRPVTERTARLIEDILGLEPGWMDLDLDVHQAKEA